MRRAPLPTLALTALLVAACGGGIPSSAPGSSGAPSGGSVSAPVESSAPTGSGQPVTTPEPASTDAASPDVAPTETSGATASPGAAESPAASASASPLACSPGGTNPDFWPGIASSVSWDVYCAVLPSDWIVSAGKYRLAHGGWLTMSYRGPGGASLTLSEGSFCTDGTGCVPSGSEIGAAAFGTLPATLVATDSGGFAIVASAGQQPSWLLVASGLDEATTRAYGAALARVAG